MMNSIDVQSVTKEMYVGASFPTTQKPRKKPIKVSAVQPAAKIQKKFVHKVGHEVKCATILKSRRIISYLFIASVSMVGIIILSLGLMFAHQLMSQL